MNQLFNRRHRGTGFSLIEIMVGLVIGMISVLAIMRVFTLSEGSRRTTSGASDAQSSGTMGLYQLQRDLRQGGQGMNSMLVLGCNVTLRAGVTINSLAPFVINHAGIPAGDAGSDTLLIAYSGSWGSPEGTNVVQQPATNQFTVTTPTSFVVNNWVMPSLQTRPAPCNLTMEQVVAVTTSPPVVRVTTGLAGMTGGTLYNLGTTPVVVGYAVRNGNLTACDYMTNNCSTAAGAADPSIWVPIASNIVALRAQYGADTSAPMDSFVDAYNQTTPTTACGWRRISASRVAVVARSIQFEKTNVTTVVPTWAGTGTNDIILSGNPDWQRHRYRVFETTVPARNMAWLGVQAGC
ncbi:PilW family protein [Solimonas sp. K1W22B-7]|uniref:PilW family protein n=1 Tax=Solimonas sp. K1W22B-7 TaxID=2303331 RepID=UPI0013C42C56|nr:PilW family protein [Solimonas sp. K1W22B-7]